MSLQGLKTCFPLLILFSGLTINAEALSSHQRYRNTLRASTQDECRVVPSDPEWPSRQKWSDLNETIRGHLVATVPVGAPCYNTTYNPVTGEFDLSTYNEAACAEVRAGWNDPAFHEKSSSSTMQTYFAKDGCNPIVTTNSGKCSLGSYVPYAIDVQDDDDVRAGLKFAQENNIRLVIRNTGHDYLGKSTAYGALALWTHHLKEISPVISDYNSADYQGPALQIQAGVQVHDVYDFLEPQGYVAIGGECPTVGMAGGYMFAGGHSLLSSRLGLAADQILEIEGIFANGTSFTATPYKNQDIYWFLCGSGSGGTIAFIKSATFKIHKDLPVSAANLTFSYANVLSDDEYWGLIDTWHSLTPNITDAGGYALATYVKGLPFTLNPVFVQNKSKEETVALIQPLIDQLDGLKSQHPNLTYNVSSFSFPNFNQAYKAVFPYQTSGQLQWSSRLIPRDIVTNRPDALSKTTRDLFNDMAFIGEAIMNPNLAVSKPLNNSVLPAWRTSIIDLILGKPYNDTAPLQVNADARQYITEHWTSALEELAPPSAGGGTYLNEADSGDPNWQASFYGENYPRQLTLKRKYDPDGFWYAKTAIGSEAWEEDAEGRLCRTSKGSS